MIRLIWWNYFVKSVTLSLRHILYNINKQTPIRWSLVAYGGSAASLINKSISPLSPSHFFIEILGDKLIFIRHIVDVASTLHTDLTLEMTWSVLSIFLAMGLCSVYLPKLMFNYRSILISVKNLFPSLWLGTNYAHWKVSKLSSGHWRTWAYALSFWNYWRLYYRRLSHTWHS